MRKKLIVIAGVALIASLAAVAIVLSLLVNIDRFRPQLARAMSAALRREVVIGHVSLSLISASAIVNDLSIADDPSFGQTPFVTAKSVRVGVALLPLLTSKRLRIESLRLQEPRLILRRSSEGTWNFSTLGAASSNRPAGSPRTSNLALSIDRLAISGGQVVIESATPRGAPVVYKDLALEVRDFSATSEFRFAGSVTAPGGGSLKMNGRAGPINARGLGWMPLEAAVDAAGVDIRRTGFVDPAAGLGGLLDLHLRIASDGGRMGVMGTMRGDKLQLVPGGSPASQPIEIAYASDYDLTANEGVVRRGDVRIGGALARVVGRFNSRSGTPAVRLTIAGRQMPMSDLQAVFPSVGASLPRGARFRSGTLDADLAANGPLDRLVITGPIVMNDATLSGFDVGSRMQAVAALAGQRGSSETAIETLGVTLRVAPEGIRADRLTCVVPAIGRLDGSGTIAASGGLDFRMLATLTRPAGVAGRVARLASFGHPEAGVPFRIVGTTASPVFVPDVTRAASEAIKSPGAITKAAGFMRSLFDRK